MSSGAPATLGNATAERAEELRTSLDEIRDRVRRASPEGTSPVLIAVSKYKPAEEILACYEHGQLDFGENYVQELVDKAAILPKEIRWSFIGTLQSNKCKTLAAIPNLYAVQTLDNKKKATALNNGLSDDRVLRVFIQVNTSGEDSKSGLGPLSPSSASPTDPSKGDAINVIDLALHVTDAKQCPCLHLQGLMTIGSIEQSHSSENRDFETLVETAGILESFLKESGIPDERWGVEGKLQLSMGMSADFEAAIRAGAGTVRVGTGIFGARKTKDEIKHS